MCFTRLLCRPVRLIPLALSYQSSVWTDFNYTSLSLFHCLIFLCIFWSCFHPVKSNLLVDRQFAAWLPITKWKDPEIKDERECDNSQRPLIISLESQGAYRILWQFGVAPKIRSSEGRASRQFKARLTVWYLFRCYLARLWLGKITFLCLNLKCCSVKRQGQSWDQWKRGVIYSWNVSRSVRLACRS